MASKSLQILPIIFLLFALAISEEPKEEADLEAAEANGKLEIIKQIKKVNEDGSYTIGYEADDGSFKIESRDVLGNIKGTYGYIDDNGEIKRVTYSTSNSSDAPSSTSEPVVQIIPKLNLTLPTSTPPPLTTSVIQTIPRRRIVSSSTTTTTATPVTARSTTALYETSTPARLLAQAKPLLRSTVSTLVLPTSKSEGQLLRPEVTLKPTDMPLYRRLAIKTTLLDEDTKPAEVRGNVLRRQLPDKSFDPRQHALSAAQASGSDSVDVYSATTPSAPRPLFTTLRPRIVSTTTPQPTIRYPQVYQKPTTEYTQESSTEPSVTVTPVPVVQIPPNNEQPQRQQFVELRHPFHRGAILVPVPRRAEDFRRPLSGPEDFARRPEEYPRRPEEFARRPEEFRRAEDYPEPIYYRRPKFRPIPVQVDENGFVREYPQAITSTAYPIQPRPTYITQNDIINEVDQIKPPVSTRDFQKLLEQLIERQSRLEKISTLTRQQAYYRQAYPEHYQPYRQQTELQARTVQAAQVAQAAQAAQVAQAAQAAQIQYIPRTQTAQPQQQHPVIVRPHSQEEYNQYSPVTFTPPPNYHPTKRMARLHDDDEYLPAPVREMLLLRMLQLAINPALPLEVPSAEAATTPQPRKEVRNVEILGEEKEEKRPSRTKRYKEIDIDYYD